MGCTESKPVRTTNGSAPTRKAPPANKAAPSSAVPKASTTTAKAAPTPAPTPAPAPAPTPAVPAENERKSSMRSEKATARSTTPASPPRGGAPQSPKSPAGSPLSPSFYPHHHTKTTLNTQNHPSMSQSLYSPESNLNNTGTVRSTSYPPPLDTMSSDDDGSEGIGVANTQGGNSPKNVGTPSPHQQTVFDAFMDTPTEEASKELIQAVDNCREKVVFRLLNDGVSPNGADRFGYTAIHKALLLVKGTESLNILKLLIKHNADVNALDMYRYRPLHAAVRQHNTPAVKELLTCIPMADPLGGGKVDQQWTSVHEAVEKGFEDVLELLLNACPGKEAFLKESAEGETILHIACRKGHYKCFETIAAKMKRLGMSLSQRDAGEHGNTPLMTAAIGGHKNILQKLEQFGVDKYAKNNHGDTMFSILAKRTEQGVGPPDGVEYDPYSKTAKQDKKKSPNHKDKMSSSKNSSGSDKLASSGRSTGSGKAAKPAAKKKTKPATTVAPLKPQGVPVTGNKGHSPVPIPATPPVAMSRPAKKSFSNMTPTQMEGSIQDADLRVWQKGRQLGKGAFGVVYEGLLRDGTLLAVKVISYNPEDEQETDNVKQEFDMIKNMKHKNILKYYGIDIQDSKLHIFMEMASNGSVASLVKRIGDALAVHVIRNYTRQILEGLEYLHSMGVIHRDIKGDNLLIGEGNVLKLCDFGSSRQFTSQMTADRCNTLIGTPLWMAPEVIDGADGYGVGADIWSLGITLIEMLACTPWKDATTETPWAMMFHIASSNKPPDGIPDSCHPMLRTMMLKTFERDPDKRPSATELLSDPFLTSAERELEVYV